MARAPALTSELLDDLVERVVEAVHPRRIILFGSGARGDLGPNSDLDLLIVMTDGTHRRQTEGRLYRELSGLGVAKDLVVVTESDVRQFADEPSLVISPALKEGRELYQAPEGWAAQAGRDMRPGEGKSRGMKGFGEFGGNLEGCRISSDVRRGTPRRA